MQTPEVPRYREIGRKLKNWRESQDKGQRDLERETGIDRKIISRYERGTARPTVEYLVAIAKMGADIYEVLGLPRPQGENRPVPITRELVRNAMLFHLTADLRRKMTPETMQEAERVADLAEAMAFGRLFEASSEHFQRPGSSGSSPQRS